MPSGGTIPVARVVNFEGIGSSVPRRGGTLPLGGRLPGKQGTELAEVIINKIKQAVNPIKFS